MAKEICHDCGQVFEPKSGRAFICPECHKQRLSAYAKKRGLSKMGSDAHAKYCAELRAMRRGAIMDGGKTDGQ